MSKAIFLQDIDNPEIFISLEKIEKFLIHIEGNPKDGFEAILFAFIGAERYILDEESGDNESALYAIMKKRLESLVVPTDVLGMLK